MNLDWASFGLGALSVIIGVLVILLTRYLIIKEMKEKKHSSDVK